jgi:Polyketide cyclase / dehydrase and lipid transport
MVAAAALPAPPAWASSDPTGSGGSLTAPELERLRGGALVVRTEHVPDFRWPEVTVYRRIAATPAQVMAVWADFGSQATYMPGLVASRIVKREGPSAFHVFYEYEVTGPNERYTVAVTVARAGQGFQASWDLLVARYARRLSGGLLVDPFDGGALVAYTSRVDPGTLGATFGSPESVSRRLQATVEALAARVERLAAEQATRLADLVSGLASIVDSR